MQLCTISLFSVHGEIKSSNLNEFETSLTKIVLIIKNPHLELVIKNTGEILLNSLNIELPYENGNLTIFEPSTFYIIVKTNIGVKLEIQLSPIMQVYIYLESSYFDQVCGLCGNFNDKQVDDFIIPNGMFVQDLDTFTHSWRSEQTCRKVPTDVIDPCSINIQKDKYISTCPPSMTYRSNVYSCQPTCKSLSTPDISCRVDFTPIDGCICDEGLYLTPHDCILPMVYFNCSLEPVGSTGIECLNSCQNLNVDCYSNECVSGCVCPKDMLADGKGGCVPSDRCTCFYNDKIYNHNEVAKIGCNNCTCDNRKWVCDDQGALADCLIYGEGNYITFDKRHYRYSGQCVYTLVQDYCGNDLQNGTFRIISENTECSDTGSTCSKSIKVFLYDHILQLSDGQVELTDEGTVSESPFQIKNTSLYLIITTSNGLVLIWDKKTSLAIKITGDFQHRVCGLCGNYDGNSNNDFNTRGQCTVEDVIEFGNSWKLLPSCPETEIMVEPCEINPHRKSWAQRQCGIILSDSFKPCHSEVDPSSYYEACVKDSCACDEGGDCDCYCTAIAVYAQACLSHCICVDWRTPNRCPVFCDYYNEEGNCEWHYKPCGVNCMKTCRNPSGHCLSEPAKVEGCYPNCPEDQPFFEETSMECVAQCGCYDNMGYYYKPGDKIESCNNCYVCECTTDGIICEYNVSGILAERY
ncbi:mucin-2-like [Rhinoderma darwinii]|uniref:mucin-2-like n=1 Tax=Rhinoderma darwinii TaxID=43563 RepID=UPI003F67B952